MQFPAGYEFIYVNHRSKKPPEGWNVAPSLTPSQVSQILLQGGNYGVRLRPTDLVIDIDPRNGGDEAFLYIDISHYPTVITPGGGKHIYMSLPEGFRVNETIPDCGKGVEFKSVGRQVLGPGSTHPNGGIYEWDIFGGEFLATGAPKCPAVLLARIEKVVVETSMEHGEWTAEQLQSVLARLDVTEFSSNDVWFSLMTAAHEATAGAGEDVFIAWSIGDELYADHENIIRARWNSLQAGKAGNAGAGTLMHILAQHGVNDLGFTNAHEEFSDFVGEPIPPAETAAPSNAVLPNDKIQSGVEDLNQRFHVVQEDGKLRVFELRTSDELKTKAWVRHSKQDFLEVCQSIYHYPLLATKTKTAEGKTKNSFVPLAKQWIESNVAGKRVYPGGVVFMPEESAERVGDSLNMWRGFAYEPKPGDWSLLQDLTFTILCQGDQVSYDYILNWLARAVQFPHIPAGTACVVKGIKGTGKGTLGRAFVKLFGVHGKHVGSMSAIVGRFNAHLQDCVAMFADEAYWAGDRAGEGMLQMLITEDSILYEAKGLTPRQGRNCVHIFMASNRDWVVPAGLDAERRFAVFECLKEVRSFAFWNALNKQMENGGYAAMLHDLLARDIRKFQVHDVPKTKALAEQKIESMDYAEQWVYSLLASGNWNGCVPIDERDTYLAHDLQRNFEDYMGNRRAIRSVETQVGMVLAKFVPGFKKIRVQRPENRIDIPAARPWAYLLRNIEAAKVVFNQSLGSDAFGD